MGNYQVPVPPTPSTRSGVSAEVDAELAGQIGPLETEAAGFAQAESRAISDLNALFAGIMPFVAGSAERVAANYGATNAAQMSIFNQAWARLNALKGERAAEAQALAQQLGAPLPMDMFTEAIDTERSVFVPEAAGELLKAGMLGQAGVQQAEAFAGRVFPLQRVRLERETRNYYRDQISGLRKQIATLKSMKPGLINERLRERQLQDYEMRLARAEAAFQQWSTKKSFEMEQKRLRAQLEEIRGSKELGEKELKQRANESDRDFALRVRQQNMDAQERKLGQQSYILTQRQNITGLVNSLASGGTPNYKDFKIVARDAKGNILTDVNGDPITYTETRDLGSTAPIRNPMQLLNKTLAVAGITRGQKQLYNFAVAQVIQVLKSMGLNPPRDPSKWAAWWKKRTQKRTPNAAQPRPSEAPGGPQR